MISEKIVIIGAISTISAGFGGAFLDAIISYLYGIKLLQRQEFNKAATEFRNAFYAELIFLKHNAIIDECGSSDDLGEFLKFGHLRSHLRAFEVFKTYLTSKERADIDKAWQKYCHNPDNPDTLYFEQYSTKNVGHEREIEIKKIALDRIGKILKFAEHK
jgi:hypothetical protein